MQLESKCALSLFYFFFFPFFSLFFFVLFETSTQLGITYPFLSPSLFSYLVACDKYITFITDTHAFLTLPHLEGSTHLIPSNPYRLVPRRIIGPSWGKEI